jgi:hypothetical protein
LSCEYLCEFSNKFETALMVFSGAWGKLIFKKSLKSKISWHCPFKLNGFSFKKQAKSSGREFNKTGKRVSRQRKI